MDNNISAEILKRLEVLIDLQLDSRDWTDQKKIERLGSHDLKAGDIARILGKPSDKISKQLYVIKNRKKKGGKRDKDST